MVSGLLERPVSDWRQTAHRASVLSATTRFPRLAVRLLMVPDEHGDERGGGTSRRKSCDQDRGERSVCLVPVERHSRTGKSDLHPPGQTCASAAYVVRRRRDWGPGWPGAG